VEFWRNSTLAGLRNIPLVRVHVYGITRCRRNGIVPLRICGISQMHNLERVDICRDQSPSAAARSARGGRRSTSLQISLPATTLCADSGCVALPHAWSRPTALETPQMSTTPNARFVPRYLTTDEAAEFLRLSPRTLEKQRVLGGGPRYRKFGRRVLYAIDELEGWANQRSHEMTSDSDYVTSR
jgi:hypothetical protein